MVLVTWYIPDGIPFLFNCFVRSESLSDVLLLLNKFFKLLDKRSFRFVILLAFSGKYLTVFLNAVFVGFQELLKFFLKFMRCVNKFSFLFSLHFWKSFVGFKLQLTFLRRFRFPIVADLTNRFTNRHDVFRLNQPVQFFNQCCFHKSVCSTSHF